MSRLKLAVPLFLSGCGGGAATLHPAHTLPEGRVSMGAGLSSTFAFGDGARAAEGSSSKAGATGGEEEKRFIDEALARSLLAPGLAPWVSARAGLGARNEAGLTYTGRSVRVDARHAFQTDTLALSVGAGASGILMHPTAQYEGGAPAGAGRLAGRADDVSANGFGVDVPVLVGWRSTPQIAEVWAGARLGFERLAADLALTESRGGDAPARAAGTRLYGGGLVGFAVGVRPVRVALELDVTYQALSGSVHFPGGSGSPTDRDTSFSGLTVVPTGALIGKFQ